MRPFAILVGAAGGSTVTAATEQVSTTPLLQFLALLATSGLMTAGFNYWRERKRAPLDRDKLVQEITAQAMEMNRNAMRQVNALSEELDHLRDELVKTQRSLRGANERIAMLEERLATATRGLQTGREQRESLQAELAAALNDRDHLKAKVSELIARQEALEAALEGKEPRRD